MSKAALDKFTTCTALELGPLGVRVNCINPGFVLGTDIMLKAGYTKEQVEETIKLGNVHSTPLGRAANPDDCAKAIAFLSNYIIKMFKKSFKNFSLIPFFN
jgi:NAD(P)-dependent dehydrogenase (short-subunit alcohol dehydrogenase family)